ncbi:unnamed protein product, partial [Lymnaea stagnalis]
IEPEVHSIEPGVHTIEPGVNPIEPGVNPIEPGVNRIEPGVHTIEPGVDQHAPLSHLSTKCSQVTAAVNSSFGSDPHLDMSQPVTSEESCEDDIGCSEEEWGVYEEMRGLCLRCRKMSDRLIPCSYCLVVKYCSMKCLSEDRQNHLSKCERICMFQAVGVTCESFRQSSSKLSYSFLDIPTQAQR